MAAPALYRLFRSRSAELVSRSIAALFGGYLLAFGFTAFFSVYLPFSRPNRVVTASLLCFAVWVAAAIYAFAARSPTRAWLVLVITTAVAYSAAYLPTEWRLRP
ncbi:DUF3649 domain-containing protein [Pseudomonas sp. MYb185]|uniref:DUF3649 domain-containing protein n=1 Tax=Pseudomonas sp. MYb185 TaxID=1848729 RepID=UPI000CFB8886|nr:DUF3649 domain-containing protein [Pseudomonas sp. MYb185]PRB77529.1 DUF3649 domain-containing protein [Pseudomonas sp. MYb185]